MRTTHHTTIQMFALCTFWAMCLPNIGLANMASPWTPGDTVGEPFGAFRGVAIESEQLHFDLRPLQTKQSEDRHIQVRATYNIHNPSPQAITGELFFVAPGRKMGNIQLDGKPIASKLTKRPVPPSWSSKYTRRHEGEGFLFALSLTPGKHTITVSYRASAYENHTTRPMRAYGIEYILSPAKAWASFGTLSIQAIIPKGWIVHSNSLKLSLTDHTLTGTFQKLPSDRLNLSVLPPSGWLALLRNGPGVLGILLGLLVCIGFGWKRADWIPSDATPNTRKLRNVVLALGTLSLAVGLGMAGFFGVTSIHPLHAARTGYESLTFAFVSVFILPPIGLVAFLLTTTYRRKRDAKASTHKQ